MLLNKGSTGCILLVYLLCISGALSFQMSSIQIKVVMFFQNILSSPEAYTQFTPSPMHISALSPIFVLCNWWSMQILLSGEIYQPINVFCYKPFLILHLCDLKHISYLLQDFFWLLWAFHSGRAPVLLPLCYVGAHLGTDWTLASHGRCVARL